MRFATSRPLNAMVHVVPTHPKGGSGCDASGAPVKEKGAQKWAKRIAAGAAIKAHAVPGMGKAVLVEFLDSASNGSKGDAQ